MKFRLYVIDKNKENEKIVLTSDEIKNCEIKFLPTTMTGQAKNIIKKEIVIVGKIIGEVDEEILSKMDINIIKEENNWRKEDSEIAKETLKLLKEKFHLPEISKIDEIYDSNRENIRGMRNWCLSYSKNDYRNIVIERIGKNKNPETFYFENMYIDSFEEKGDTTDGNGEFRVIFRQKVYHSGKDQF